MGKGMRVWVKRKVGGKLQKDKGMGNGMRVRMKRKGRGR